MKTSDFLIAHAGSMNDYLYRALKNYAEMYDLWEDVGVSTKLQILEIAKSCGNHEPSIIQVHRSLLMESLRFIGSKTARNMVIEHISIIDRFWEKDIADIAIKSNNQAVTKITAAKANQYVKRVYDMLILFPSRPKGWLERSIFFCDRVGVSDERVEKIFSLYIPNPYDEAKYARVT